MAKPTASWERIGDRFYRKTQLYTNVFDEELELENYTVAGAPYSGAVGKHCTHPLAYTANKAQLSVEMRPRSTPSAARKPSSRQSIYTAAPES